jgi:hypothetical protein
MQVFAGNRRKSKRFQLGVVIHSPRGCYLCSIRAPRWRVAGYLTFQQRGGRKTRALHYPANSKANWYLEHLSDNIRTLGTGVALSVCTN